MWTDMSEIVRPTRDGIHGREYINTVVDLGRSLPYLQFDAAGRPAAILPYLEENERLFGISIERDLLTVDGQRRSPVEGYRKIGAV